MVIRLLGIIVGLLFIVVSPVMAYNQVESLAMCISMFIMGIVFLVYGVKGNHGVSKILPKNSNLKLW